MARDRNYIGSYRLLKLVRAGATCQIWEVYDEIHDRRCALKTLQDDYRSDRAEIALLKHEYEVGKTLHHKNCIEFIEYDASKGIPFLAMDYFESQNLKQWIRAIEDDRDLFREQLPSIIKQAAEGVYHLHEQGWIHRDIKPDNFLINTDFRVKLIDFAIACRIRTGIAKVLAGRPKVQGTRSYMSPEQIRGKQLTPSSDVYSFGCVLFELFGGRPPYTGGSPDDLLQKHLTAPIPSVTAFSKDASPEFGDLIARMMSKNVAKRPASMLEFLRLIAKMRLITIMKK